jgi:hypothetical protein
MQMIKWALNSNVSVVYYKIYLSSLRFSKGLRYLVPHMSESGSQFSLLLGTQNILNTSMSLSNEITDTLNSGNAS